MIDREFYIGYLPKMQKRTARAVRSIVLVFLVFAAASAVVFVLGQQPFAMSSYESNHPREFTGTIQAKPIPFLIMETGGTENGLPGFRRIPLVAEGKSGAGESLAGFDEKRVSLRGVLIHRDGIQMIEIANGSVRPSAGPSAGLSDESESLGTMRLKGEIIDSKCYLGVMNPGNRKTHRSCAVACIRGGIPPMFLVKDAKGNTSELWLLSKAGAPVNEQVLDYIAEPVEITGEAVRRGDQLFLYFDPGSIRRLN